MEWKEAWRNPEWEKPEPGKNVILRSNRRVAMAGWWDGEIFLRRSKDGDVEVSNVDGWIPWPLSSESKQTASYDLPVEVAYQYLYRDYIMLKRAMKFLLGTKEDALIDETIRNCEKIQENLLQVRDRMDTLRKTKTRL